MAVVFAFNVMVVRKNEIHSKYPGGLDQFRSEAMRGWWFEDKYLLVCSSMGSFDHNFVDRLKSFGVEVFFTTESEPPEENVKRCCWLEWDIYERREFKSPDGSLIHVHPVARHWLKGTDAGDTITQPSRLRR